MKATAQLSSERIVIEKSWPGVLAELIKARLTLLVLLTTLVGFYVGQRGAMDYALMWYALLGTALLASGAAALNQWMEREFDALMRRTQDRPLPSGRLQPPAALWFGTVCAVGGVVCLALAVNWITALLGTLTLLCYLFIYTPLKRVTWMNTLVGAIPGAMPPLMGWTAARGEIGIEGLSLFAILAAWQIPHFLAIAWIYSDEYAKAGFQMLPVVDPQGRRTSAQAVVYATALLAFSVLPFLLILAGPVYLAGALALGLGFLWLAIGFARGLTMACARRLFYASIIYLPMLLILMVVNRMA